MDSLKSKSEKIKTKCDDKPVEKVHRNVKTVQELNKIGCKTHGENYLITDVRNGDSICEKCGLVVEERMVCDEAEWRNFDGDSVAEKWSKSRTGDVENPFLSADCNLGTTIKMFDGNKNNDSSYSGSIMKHFKRRSVDNALMHAFKEINDMGDRISLPFSVVLRAKQLYTQLYKKIKLKGNILLTDSKTAASLYIACRLENCYRSHKEIAAIYDVNKRELNRAIRRAVDCLDLKNTSDSPGIEMIDRYCGYLQSSRDERRKSRLIAEAVQNQNLGKKILPEVIAGTSIYLATASTQGN